MSYGNSRNNKYIPLITTGEKVRTKIIKFRNEQMKVWTSISKQLKQLKEVWRLKNKVTKRWKKIRDKVIKGELRNNKVKHRNAIQMKGKENDHGISLSNPTLNFERRLR